VLWPLRCPISEWSADATKPDSSSSSTIRAIQTGFMLHGCDRSRILGVHKPSYPRYRSSEDEPGECCEASWTSVSRSDVNVRELYLCSGNKLIEPESGLGAQWHVQSCWLIEFSQ